MSCRRIEKIVIKKVGALDDFSLVIPKRKTFGKKAEVNIIVGENASGKSTLLYSIASCFPGADGAEFDKRTTGKGNSPSYSWLSVEGGGKRMTTARAALDSSGKLKKYPTFDDVLTGLQAINYSQTRVQMTSAPANDPLVGAHNFLGQKSEDLEKNGIKVPYWVFSYSGNRTFDSAKAKRSQPSEVRPLNESGSFSSYIDSSTISTWIVESISKSKLIEGGIGSSETDYGENLRRVEAFFTELIGNQVCFGVDVKRFTPTFKIENEEVNLDVLAEGLKSVISWLLDLTIRLEHISFTENLLSIFDANIIILLDEIDVHLHPMWQMKILPAIQNLLPNSQIFITTHSPFVTMSMNDANVFLLVKENGTGVLKKSFECKTGQSYDYLLRELFGVSQDFDSEAIKEVEAYLEVARSKDVDLPELEKHKNELIEKFDSEELKVIIEHEYRKRTSSSSLLPSSQGIIELKSPLRSVKIETKE